MIGRRVNKVRRACILDNAKVGQARCKRQVVKCVMQGSDGGEEEHCKILDACLIRVEKVCEGDHIPSRP